MARGRLLVFEGLEGVGKTTQIARLVSVLDRAGVPALAVREPGETPVGIEIRRLLLDPQREITGRAEALLFMASRAELVERTIRPALAAGTLVIADRFFLSTYAYQVAGRELPADAVQAANALATDGLVPDLTLLLEFPVAAGLARAATRSGHDRMEGAGEAFLQRVSQAFAEFASVSWQRTHPEGGPIERVNAEGTEAEVDARVRGALTARWSELGSAFATISVGGGG